MDIFKSTLIKDYGSVVKVLVTVSVMIVLYDIYEHDWIRHICTCITLEKGTWIVHKCSNKLWISNTRSLVQSLSNFILRTDSCATGKCILLIAHLKTLRQLPRLANGRDVSNEKFINHFKKFVWFIDVVSNVNEYKKLFFTRFL